MVLKKPYAFLIKHFKLIHFLLFIFIANITFNFNKIVNFFSLYVKDNVNVFEGISNTYIPLYQIIFIILIIIFALFMYLLMQKKLKPKLFYIFLFVYYIGILTLTFIAYGQISSLAEFSITKQTARAYSDIYLIFSLPNYYFLIISIIRSIGFDIKKFNFKKDLEELEIKSDDDEEFEFMLGTETYRLKRKIRRVLRELRYYFFENKFLISILGAIILGGSIILLIVNTQIINKAYTKGDTLSLENFGIVLNNTYVTEKNYNSNIIKKGQKYIIVDLTVKNNGFTSSLAREKIYLTYGNNTTYYSSIYKDAFLDLGKGYAGGAILSNKSERILLIFEISLDVNTSDYKLNILKDKTYDKNNNLVYNFNNYKLNPLKVDKNINVEEKQINEVMYLGSNFFKDTSLIIKSAEIKNAYEYSYENCKESKCETLYDVEKVNDSLSQKLLILTYDLKLNPDNLINNSMVALQKDKLIFDLFLKVKYSLNDKDNIINISSKLNSRVKNKVFINIPNKVNDSKKIELLFNTRENHYSIEIKAQ